MHSVAEGEGPDGNTILLAVSGGSDSMGLLQLAAQILPPGRLFVGFVDHGLRTGTEAEWELVRGAAQSLGIAARRHKVDTAPSEGGGVQEWAREVRYSALVEMAGNCGAHHVATAHTADDQAETVMMRILRGTGVDGLAGIPESRTLSDRVTLIRPLLSFRREMIRDILRDMNCVWAEDPSNQNRHYQRVRVREELLPLMEEMQPGIARRLNALAGETEALVRLSPDRGDVDSLIESINLCDGLKVSHEIFSGHPRPVQGRLVRAALRRLKGDLRRVERVHIDGIVQALNDGVGSTNHALPGPFSAWVFRGSLYLFPTKEIPIPQCDVRGDIPDKGTATLTCDPLGVSATVRAVGPFTCGPIILRTRARGDRVFGSDRKLSEVFNDAGIPAFYRDHVPLLCDSRGVISCPGVLTAADTGLHIEWVVDTTAPCADLKLVRNVVRN